MITYLLHPPNEQALSGNVIGPVQQRAPTSQRRTIRGFKLRGVTKPLQPPKLPAKKHYSPHLSTVPATRVPSELEQITDSLEVSPEQPKMNSYKTKSGSSRKRSSTSLTPSEIRHLFGSTTKATDSSVDDLPLSELVNLANASEVLYRERRRLAQIRYRKKQQEYMESMEEDVRKLHEEIKDLTERRHHIVIGISRPQNVWTIGTEYFRLFRDGLPESMYTFALSFLRKSMTSDIIDGSTCGLDAVLQNWRLFSLCFEDVNVEVERLKKGIALNTIVVVIITSVTISKNTLRLVFPHLYSEEQGNANEEKRSKIALDLVGQRLVMRGSVLFEWDPQINRVVRMQSQSDMLTPMLKVLGSLEAVSIVFEGALVSPECRWIVRSGGQEQDT